MQCCPYLNPDGCLHRNRTSNPNTCGEPQRPWIAEAVLEESQAGSIPWVSRLVQPFFPPCLTCFWPCVLPSPRLRLSPPHPPLSSLFWWDLVPLPCCCLFRIPGFAGPHSKWLWEKMPRELCWGCRVLDDMSTGLDASFLHAPGPFWKSFFGEHSFRDHLSCHFSSHYFKWIWFLSYCPLFKIKLL